MEARSPSTKIQLRFQNSRHHAVVRRARPRLRWFGKLTLPLGHRPGLRGVGGNRQSERRYGPSRLQCVQAASHEARPVIRAPKVRLSKGSGMRLASDSRPWCLSVSGTTE